MTRHFLRDDDLSPAEQAEVLAWPRRSRPTGTPPARSRGRAPSGSSSTSRRCAPRRRSRPESPSSAATPCSSTAASPGSAPASRSPTPPGCSAGWSSAIVWRTFGQERLEEMAAYAGVPVVNALTDEFHPCQLLADLQTIEEHKGTPRRADRRVPRRRRLEHVALVPARLRHRRDARAGQRARRLRARRRGPRPGPARSPVRRAGPPPTCVDPVEAVTGADVVVTDTWVSMGKEERGRRAQQAVPALRARRAPCSRTPRPTRS